MAKRYGITRRDFLAGSVSGVAVAALAGTGGSALLGACGSSSSGSGPGSSESSSAGIGTGTPVRGGTITIGMPSDIQGFTPSAGTTRWDNTGLTYANAVYDSLTAVARDGTWRPWLAQSVTQSADRLTWTIALRPNVVFHDGSALTAEVAVANIEALRSGVLTSHALTDIASVTQTGPLTFDITTTEPVDSIPYAISNTQVGYIVAMAQLNSTASQPTPIGTGPFKFVSWTPNEQFVVTRNPNYWQPGLPYLDGITFKTFVADDARENALLAGQIDAMISRDPQAQVDLRNRPGFAQVTNNNDQVGEPDVDFIMLNCAQAPTSDLTVRQALAYAIDAKTLLADFGKGVTIPVTSPFYPSSPYHSPDNHYPTFDLAKAKQLVAQAAPNHGGSISVQLVTIPDPSLSGPVQAIAQMWSNAGIKSQVSTIDESELINNVITGNFQAVTFEFFSAPDPDLNYVWWTSKNASGPLALNFARNKDPQIDAALELGRTSADPAVRAKAYQTIDNRLAADLPYLWLRQAPWSMTARDQVQNFAGPKAPDGTLLQGFASGVFNPIAIWKT